MPHDPRSKFDPQKHHRKTFRIKDYDDAQSGAYYVTISVNVLFGSGAFDQWQYKEHLNLLQTSLSSLLPEGIKVRDPGRLKDGVLTEAERSGILALHRFLREVDPNQERIGLHRIPTYTGDFTWVCRKHYDLMQPKIPEVIHPHD